MANTVIAHKKSATPGAAPPTLANGELAINYADGIIFYKNANGVISSIQTGSNFSTINANGSLIVADSPADILTVIAGANINITGDPVTDSITISASLAAGDPTPAFNQANTAYVSSFLLMGG